MTDQNFESTRTFDPADSPDAIAVIGMAGRFPGAHNLAQYWRNLRDGVESIVPLSEDDLTRAGIESDAIGDRRYIRSGAPLGGIDEFDAELFGFTRAAAEGMDPQHRLFLQTVWHAVEDAGYLPSALDGSVGVYGTSSASGYLLNNLMSRVDVDRVIGQGASFEMIDLSLRNDKDHVATRVAHQFDLRGPALSVQTACSSSAVAVHLACQALLSGEIDTAIAGGVSIRVPNVAGYWHEPGAMTSPSGRCRPFDVRADGTVFGSGVGVVVLKSLQRALADGDDVHAVILGSAINNDGAAKMTYAAPTAAGQAAAIAEAHAVAGIDPAEVTFVETHGTGTPLGDPVEVDGLRQAFELGEQPRTQPCRLGSVKGNIGHLEVASGIAGLIKAILCLKHRAVPPTLHYTAPNPELHLDNGPFEIPVGVEQWQSNGPLRAGVSSFGVGGTNVHLVLSEPPTRPASAAPEPGPYPLMLSARDAARLAVGRATLADELEADETIDISAVAATLAARPKDGLRAVTVVRDRTHAISALRAGEGVSGDAPSDATTATDRVVLLFPGQGAQHIGMARGLYEAEPKFAENFDRCAAGFDAQLGIDLRRLIFSGRARELERTDRSQAALFTVEYALARLLESRGVRPSLLIGHSVGEYVAATIAGVMDLPTAIAVVAERGRVMQAAPSGMMLAVPLGADDAARYLSDDLDIATVNEPGGCVVSGSAEAIADLTGKLAGDGITARRVRTSHAFHSRMMESAAEQFATTMQRTALREPRITLGSNVTGSLMTAAEATDPSTWVRQIRSTVRFVDELDAALDGPHRVLIEVGPGGALTSAARRHPKFDDTHRVVRLMRHHAQDRDDHEVFLEGLSQLWIAGLEPDLGVIPARRTLLPGYPFLPERHWVSPLPGRRGAPGGAAGTVPGPDAEIDPGSSDGVEATLARVWAACLGVDAVDPHRDFFDLGGDSLIAIGVTMAAGHAGIDITPQDLYDHPTVSSLAAAVTERDTAGALSHPGAATDHPPLPPIVHRLLDGGVADRHRWRIPIVLCLRPDVDAAAAAAVLDALVARHQALRVRLDERTGMWEQSAAAAGENVAAEVAEVVADPGADLDAAAWALISAATPEFDVDAPAVTAVVLRDPEGGPSRLALTLQGAAGDPRSRDVLLGDLLTGFSQRTAGVPISLAPEPTSWFEWCARVAALAAHPDVLATAGHWLETAARPFVRIATADPQGPPVTADFARVSTTFGVAETAEVDDVRRRTGVRLEELMATALVRGCVAVAGGGRVAVDVESDARTVLKPDLDLRDTVGWFTTIHPLVVDAPVSGDGLLLDAVQGALRGVPHHGLGYGLLRYLHAPTATRLGRSENPDVHLEVVGTVPEAPAATGASASAPVWFADDTALAVRETVPGLGHAVTLRVFRTGGRLHADWWYDRRRVPVERVEALAAATAEALTDLARADAEPSPDSDDWDLIDLSESDAG